MASCIFLKGIPLIWFIFELLLLLCKNFKKLFKSKFSEIFENLSFGGFVDVFVDSTKENLNDEGIKSYDLLQYILCSTSHLSTFTITSFSPSYLLSKSENNQEISEEEMIRNSRGRGRDENKKLEGTQFGYLNNTILDYPLFYLEKRGYSLY